MYVFLLLLPGDGKQSSTIIPYPANVENMMSS